MRFSLATSARKAHSRQGGSSTILLVCLALIIGISIWFSKMVDMPASKGGAASGPEAPEPFLELGTTVVVPTIPEYTLDDLREWAGVLLPHERTFLDQQVALIVPGQTVDVRQVNGMVGRGEILEVGSNDLVQVQGSLSNRMPFTQLDPWDRLRVDAALRGDLAHHRARALAREELATLGVLPAVSNSGPGDLSISVEAGEDKAQLELGLRYILGRGMEANPSLGFFLVHLAAQRGLPAAQQQMGLLYLNGRAVGRSREAGLRWMALSAWKGWKPADDYLAENKLSREQWEPLAKEMEKGLSKELEAGAARRQTVKQELVDQAVAAADWTYRPDGLQPGDFRIRYYWWRPADAPGFRSWFDEQGRRHLSTAPGE